MNVIGNPGVEKVDFELWSLAVSADQRLRPVPRLARAGAAQGGRRPRDDPGGVQDRRRRPGGRRHAGRRGRPAPSGTGSDPGDRDARRRAPAADLCAPSAALGRLAVLPGRTALGRPGGVGLDRRHVDAPSRPCGGGALPQRRLPASTRADSRRPCSSPPRAGPRPPRRRCPRPGRPAATDSTTASGCTRTARPRMNGCRMWPSICCTASTTTSTISGGEHALGHQRDDHRERARDHRADQRDEREQEDEDGERHRHRTSRKKMPSPMKIASIRATITVPRT